MKLFVEKIIPRNGLFVVKEESFPYNDFPLHIHPEYELILILKSYGKRYVGDHIDSFFPGDLCLFGPELPHTYYNKHLPDQRDVHQIVVQFREDFLGEHFFDKPQFAGIKRLLERSAQGVCFSGGIREQISKRMNDLLHADEVEAAAMLISMLNQLSRSTEFELLSHQKQMALSVEKDTQRMNKIYHYVLDHFRQDIRLEDVADLASLSVPAFCRYFKKHTRKTLTDFVLELRVGHACGLLRQKELSVLEVCYESGFNNISYFNRQFKRQTGMAPLQYRRKLVSPELSS
ncbi:MAG: helix-turn-helix domain-containing protein [Mucilaginibacter polytrichastri]|nr:helix-turn-helix domain-containing protein [Mucilaginibacter polytrichastri]